MAEHNVFGQSGEDIACTYLTQKGYHLLDRNWRSGHKELDIVAVDHDTLVIVEVKTRRNTNFGRPEDAVSPMKMRRTVNAADAYIRCNRLDLPVRFDVITIVGSGQQPHINHIIDAFRPML